MHKSNWVWKQNIWKKAKTRSGTDWERIYLLGNSKQTKHLIIVRQHLETNSEIDFAQRK